MTEQSISKEFVGARLERVYRNSMNVVDGKLLYVMPHEYEGGYVVGRSDRGEYRETFNSLDRKVVAEALSNLNERGAPGASIPSPGALAWPELDRPPRADPETLAKQLVDACELLRADRHAEVAQLSCTENQRVRRYLRGADGSVVEDTSTAIILNALVRIIRQGKTHNIFKSFAFTDSRSLLETLSDGNLRRSTLGVFREDDCALGSVTSGGYSIVVSPEASGMILHEMLGHLLEADLIYNHPLYIDGRLRLGNQIASEAVTFIDDPTLKGHAGAYKYDDEGARGREVCLLRSGRVAGRLHTSETASLMGEDNNGHARSIDFRNKPYARMSTTYPLPGKAGCESLLDGAHSGIFVKSAMLAKNDLEHFILLTKEAYRIEHGRLAEPLRPFAVYGNIFEYLENIAMIGNDLEFHDLGCTKGYSDAWIPVTAGGCSMLITDAKVGAL